MKKISSISLFLVMMIPCFAQNQQEADLAQLRALNAKFINNFVTSDSASHSKIIHKDFVCITSNGQYLNRKDYLDSWPHGFEGITYWDYRDENIKLFGNVALVHSANKYVAERDGKEITGMSMYTDTYIKENGEWKCIQAQITKVAPENYPGDQTIVKKYDYRNKDGN